MGRSERIAEPNRLLLLRHCVKKRIVESRPGFCVVAAARCGRI